MATGKPKKEPASGRKRGPAVGTVRQREIAERGTGGRGICAFQMDGACPTPNTCGNAGCIAYIYAVNAESKARAAESRVQARVKAGADRPEPIGADKPAAGGQQAGGISDEGGSEAARFSWAPEDWRGYYARGLQRATRDRIAKSSCHIYAHGYANGWTEQNWEASLSARTKGGIAIAACATFGAVVLATARWVCGG
jgi:hypothetical protein